MSGARYPTRSIPDTVDRAVLQRSRQEAKSLNTVVVETFARGLEAQVAPPVHTDLDHLIGAWRENPEFDRAVAEFERIDDAE